MLSVSTIIFLLILSFMAGSWFYQWTQKKRPKQSTYQSKVAYQPKIINKPKPKITVSILPNRHRQIVIDYDSLSVSAAKSEAISSGMWVVICSAAIFCGIGFGYCLYRILA